MSGQVPSQCRDRCRARCRARCRDRCRADAETGAAPGAEPDAETDAEPVPSQAAETVGRGAEPGGRDSRPRCRARRPRLSAEVPSQAAETVGRGAEPGGRDGRPRCRARRPRQSAEVPSQAAETVGRDTEPGGETAGRGAEPGGRDTEPGRDADPFSEPFPSQVSRLPSEGMPGSRSTVLPILRKCGRDISAMTERRRLLLRNFLSPEICKELEFIHKSCCTIGYTDPISSPPLSLILSPPTLSTSSCPSLKERVEEYFGCEYELFVEFTGLISWCKGASIGWHSDDNRDHLKQRDFSVPPLPCVSDTSITIPPQDRDEDLTQPPTETTELEANMKNQRPRRAIKPPERYQDYPNSGVGRIEQVGMPQPPETGRPPPVSSFEEGQSSASNAVTMNTILSTIRQLEARMDNTDRRIEINRPLALPDPDPPYGLARFRHSDQWPLPDNASVSGFPQPYGFSSNRHPIRSTAHSDMIPNRFSNINTDSHTQPPLPYSTSNRPHPSYGGNHPHSGWNSTTTLPQSTPGSLRHHTSWDLPDLNPSFGPPLYDQPSGCQPSCWDLPPIRPQNIQGFDFTPRVRMDPPRFDGSDATNWIARVQYYFDHVQMPDVQRLHYVVMMFDPPAADWIFNYRANNMFVTWHDFLEDVRQRFDPHCYESYIGLLSKLCQTGSVVEYQATFEKLLNRISGVPESTLLPTYIAGLKQPTQRQVKLHRPPTLASAFALAQELSACNDDRLTHSSGFQRRPWQSRDSRFNTGSSSTQGPPQSAGLHQGKSGYSPKLGSDHSKLSVIRLSREEKADRSKKGLCWYCDERWAPGHSCKRNFLAYMGTDDDIQEIDPPTDVDQDEVDLITDDISHVHSIDGLVRSKSISLIGDIRSTTVRVLVDTGSSHDFIHPRIAEQLSLPLTSISPFRVYVGNGASLLCSHVTRVTELKIQDVLFLVDLYILPIHGPDIILGMTWLESLGRADYPRPRRISLNPMSAIFSQPYDYDIYELFSLTEDTTSSQSNTDICFPTDLPALIRNVLQSHCEVFQLPAGLPPPRQFDHRIHLLPNTKPVNVRPYRYPYFQKNEIEHQVKQMLDQGIIRHSQSSFSSPVLLVRKKDGTFRFCVDYRALNTATVPDHFPIPTADELFDELGAARFFTELDLRSGYHQIRMHHNDVFKTAFRIHEGHYEFLVMPFGLTNAPSTATLEEHAFHLSEVLSILALHKFFVKLSKCSFCSNSVDYLGHLIMNGVLKADPKKIESMSAWPTPKNIKQLRGFLGLTGYYRRFIRHYAMIAAPLTELLKKDAFRWSTSTEDSFIALKFAMTTAPVLHLPDFNKPFYLETDASDVGIGAVLLQDEHPLAFYSKKLGLRRRSASTYHKELYAIVEAVQKWRQYLLGREFVIRSDQKSLKELLQQVVQTPDQHFYIRKLMGFKFRIEYKQGSTNRAADALSRVEMLETETASLFTALAHPLPAIFDKLRRETTSSPKLKQIVASISDGTAPSHLSYCDGLIYYNRRVYVDASSPSRLDLLHEHHSTLTAGHPGVERTFRRLAMSFFWPKMRKDVEKFVATCVDCQTTKYSTQKPAGLLQPLPIPSKVWEDVSMDFITGLPPSRGYTTIMVVVDRLTKYAHFAPLPTRFDAMRVALLFVDTVVKHNGFPKTLVSNRDTVFLNAVWVNMLNLSGTKLHFTTAYHPQSDGQTEVRNRGLEQYLRVFTADKPSKWANLLPWAELALNCFYHEGLGTSPFHALYGREPPALIAAPPSRTTPPAVADLIRQRRSLLVDLRRNLEGAQQRMRSHANSHRPKLARRYYGPFKVLERIGPVAYRLELPPGARIHDVFHVSLLRKFVQGQPGPSAVDLPLEFIANLPVSKPIQILGSRIVLHDDLPVDQVLDKDVPNGGGVDTSITIPPQDRDEDLTQPPTETTELEANMKNQRPRRAIKPPERYQDYVDFFGGLFHFQDGEPSTIASMAGDVVIYTADERNTHSVSEISEGERITLALWFSRDASHDEDANLLKSLSNCSLSSPVESIASCFPVLASTNMYWFPPEEASRFQRGFNICSARLCTLGFDVCFSDNSVKECQFTSRDSCSINLKVLEEPLYLTCGDALLTWEFVNILHALQVVQFYYWKASEFDTDESTDTVSVPLSELQRQKITRLRAVLVKDLQLAETLIGRINLQKPLKERFRSRFSDVVCMWEAYTLKLHNELVMSLPYWVANHFIFSAANYD
ncbi:hypothetical protein SASPL_134849 [Salvia splendens]|uniref:Integrase catalytic domain-containing protein n=1 Tax=Salvia splendens TaxID=180675 RepID=A0A8X8ZF96_SALSN|nr:hypothetical protein SASPL_134849 [Salvia splendens]